jgi:hypothetical protein
MARFPSDVAARLLVKAKRHCCLCLKWCGQRIQIHHIVPDAEGGAGIDDNGVPVCLDCHAEIESRSNMGRSFTAEELRQHRDNWFATVRDHSEVLIRAARSQAETGPLEALLAELDFNRLAVSGNPNEGFPPLAVSQFERAIATNSLAALPASTREAVQRTYVLIRRINYHFEEMASMDRRGGSGGAFGATQDVRNQLRGQLVELIPRVLDQLERALGRADSNETAL